MTTDPFGNFERSRIGLSIPAVLFMVGGVLTYLSINSLHGVLLREEEAARARQSELEVPGRDVPTGNAPVAGDIAIEGNTGLDVDAKRPNGGR
jgi:hypothetical protein